MTPVPVMVAGGIDDDFSKGLNPDVWDFDPATWGFNSGKLMSTNYGSLILKNFDSSNYRFEIWTKGVLSGSTYLFNVGDSAYGVGSIYYYGDDGKWVSGVFQKPNKGQWQATSWIPSGEFDSLPSQKGERIVYVKIEVHDSRFTVSDDKKLYLDTQLLNGPQHGTVGVIGVRQQTIIERIRVTPLQP
jgi:hypothetical protein